jgi:hypothetical protein
LPRATRRAAARDDILAKSRLNVVTATDTNTGTVREVTADNRIAPAPIHETSRENERYTTTRDLTGSDEGAGEEVGLARADVGDADGHVDVDQGDAPALGYLGLDGGDVGRDEGADEPVVSQRDRDPAALVGVYSEGDRG